MDKKPRRIANPFLVYGYEGPHYFCDREEETRKLVSALANGRNVTLAAQRRIGKTGLIHNVFNRVRNSEDDIICIYVDIFPTRCLADFVHILGKAVFEAVQSHSERLFSRVASFLSGCRPAISFDPLTGSPSFSIDIPPSMEEKTLSDIFDCLEKSDTPVYIAIDEFQQVASYPESGTEAMLRSRIQFMHNVHFIFSGSQQHLIYEMFLSAKRPFYNSTQIMSLTTIPLESYYTFAENLFAEGGRTIDGTRFKFIYDSFEGHTWYVQTILNRLYETGGNITDKSQVIEAIKSIVRENTMVYQTTIAMLPDKQLQVLKALAKEGKTATPNKGAFIQKYSLKAASSVSSALMSLVDKELVYRSQEGYSVYDRFMEIWLREDLFSTV
ncbi:ATPase [Prevotella sp. P5-92]|uniref:AAA family ATPase n=1 Tax=Prevotella sp. P5-92 TaxID=2024222 RepID=UPI000B978B6C|nr:ATP-binding protein [Prevotella sp. P5-92]OYP58283.1 ATPase [Prevotella sp. P5-92]